MDMTYDFLADAVTIPDRLGDLHAYLDREIAATRRSRFSAVQRSRLLLEGSTTQHLSAADYRLVDEFPSAAEVARSYPAILRHLERLVMPEAQAEARDEYVDLLTLDPLEEVAASLVKLLHAEPEAVTALLELRIGRAAMIQGSSIRATATRIAELLPQMAKVRVAYITRCVAAECGRELAAPFGWETLDGVDGAPRLGLVHKRLMADLSLVGRALDIYTLGRRTGLSAPFQVDGILLARAGNMRVTLSLLNKPAPDKEARAFTALGLDQRAKVQLGIWRRAHGEHLEDILEAVIVEIGRELKTLRARLDERRGAHHANIRIGNIAPVTPLLRLAMAARYAIAWTAEPFSHDNHDYVQDPAARRTEARSGIEQLLNWTSSEKVGSPPLPPVHYHQASLATDLFTFLRYVFVDDDNMMPASLRRVTDVATGEIVEVHNQAAAIRATGWRVPLHTLLDAHRYGKKSPPEISREMSALIKKKKLNELTSSERAILDDMRLRFEIGFTAS